jgi:hypothetical protein
MRRLFAVLAILGFLATTGDIGFGQSGSTSSIEGVWRGTSAVTTGANASSNMNRQPMLLIYTKGYYAVVAQDGPVPLPPRTPPPPLQTPGKPTDAEKIARYQVWAPVIAQAGTYELKGNVVTQRNLVAKGPLTVVVREVRLEDGGKTMVEIQKSASGQPVSETRRTFTRVDRPSQGAVEGVWQGTTIVTTGANATTNPKRLPNIQIYTRGHYAFVAQDAGTPRPPRQAPPAVKTPGKPTDAEKIALADYWAPVGAAAGSYDLSGNMLTQHPIISIGGVLTDATFESKLEDGGKTWIHIVKSAPGQPVSETRRTLTRLE